jgi:hypothetical protein
MQAGVEIVTIDNTNLSLWEMKPYVQEGLKHQYTVELLEPSTDWRHSAAELSQRNSHGVSEAAINRMLLR